MLRIWGRLNSSNVKKAVWAAEEVGVPYERTDAGLQFGIVNTPDYRAMNPNGLVPTVIDDGLVMWESNAIVRYLAEKYGSGTLWPTGRRERFEADRMMDWQAGSFSSSFTYAFRAMIRMKPEDRDMAAVEVARIKTGEMAAILDGLLKERDYVAGSSFTMGDIPIGVAVHIWLNTPLPRAPCPNIERWYRAILARPAAQKVLYLPLT